MSTLHALTHGTRSLGFGYVIVWAGLLAGLIHARASVEKLLLSPLLAVPALLLAALVSALLTTVVGSGGTEIGVLQFGLNLLLFLAIAYLLGRVVASAVRASGPAYRRGAIVRKATPVAAHADAGITLGGIPVAPADETKHFKFIGTTGTGKSTAIHEVLSAALARGDRAVIADPDGGYLARFYDEARGDVILNPFDGEARKWDLIGEITNDYDVEQLARSLIPDGRDGDGIWSEYARTFFAAVVQQSIEGGDRDDANVYRLLTCASVEELRLMLAGTSAGPFLEPGNEKMFSSVRSIASSGVRALNYTTRQQAVPFSVREWVRHGAAKCAGGRGGVLFLPYKAGEIAALRSVISAWIRIGIFEAMDRDEGDQHLWFVIDELDSLGEIDGLKDALARLRKFGGRCILGFQSIAQVSGLYGKGTAETIVENCGSTLILRCSASERGGTSEFASKLIGHREVVHTTRSRAQHPGRWMPLTTRIESLKIEPAIMASEIERLPDLAGFLKLASVPDWRIVTLTPRKGDPGSRPRKPAAVVPPTPDPNVERVREPGVPGKAPRAAPDTRTRSAKVGRPPMRARKTTAPSDAAPLDAGVPRRNPGDAAQ